MKVVFWISLVLLCFANAASAQWLRQTVVTNASLRGLSVVSESIIWASGTGGTVIKSTDGGKSWQVMTVPGAERLDFRDIEAFDASTAYILSVGNGHFSRIYKTSDGGITWTEQFRNKDEKAFYDAIACWDRDNCIALSDPVDELFRLIITNDGGRSWRFASLDKMPRAMAAEAAFAASGTCLIVNGKTDSFFVTGGSEARVFRSKDRGLTWLVARAPIAKGTAGSGVFSIAMRDANHGLIVGGNYEKPDDAEANLAFTKDGGRTWKAARGLSGYRSGIAFVDRKTVIAVGTSGTDLSRDGGKTWKKIGAENLNAVAAHGRRAVWAVGPGGMVVKLKSK